MPPTDAPRVPDLPDVPAARLAAAKQAATLQVLFQCARLLNDHALEEVRRRTGHRVRPAHTNLFPHIDLAGTRPTVLAQRVGISKQAVGQLVAELEQMGMVERVADPADGRARLVRFATDDQGESVLFQGLSVLAEVEAGLAADLGADDWATLRALLLRLQPLAAARAGNPPGGPVS